MPSACLLVILLLSLIISLISGETEVKFAGQTEFVVNETTTTVIRLVIERIGDPVNVTAIVSVRNVSNLIALIANIYMVCFLKWNFYLGASGFTFS